MVLDPADLEIESETFQFRRVAVRVNSRHIYGSARITSLTKETKKTQPQGGADKSRGSRSRGIGVVECGVCVCVCDLHENWHTKYSQSESRKPKKKKRKRSKQRALVKRGGRR
jgi:hypothetical protein